MFQFDWDRWNRSNSLHMLLISNPVVATSGAVVGFVVVVTGVRLTG